ncbi:MAG: hypothetical protein AB8G96_03270 [Phycisphaerales bacterium]
MTDPVDAARPWRELSLADPVAAASEGVTRDVVDVDGDDAARSGHPLLQQIAADWSGDEPPTARHIMRWRKVADQATVAAAIDAVIARRRLEDRWPEAERALSDREGAEQATAVDVSRPKMQRLAEGAPVVWDLGCGAGGDAMRLVELPHVRRIVLVDRDERRLRMAMHNVALAGHAVGRPTLVRWSSTAADADASPPRVGSSACELVGVAETIDAAFATHCAGAAVHLDPSRRQELQGRRRLRLEDHDPGPDVIAALVTKAWRLAVKLGPGVSAAELSAANQAASETANQAASETADEPANEPADDLANVGLGRAELEYIARAGRMVQAVAWYGDGASVHGRRATQSGLARTERVTIAGDAASDDATWSHLVAHGPPAPGDCLLVPHPAIERARLVWTALAASVPEGFAASELAPGLGIIATPEPVASPWFTAWTVREVMPWRLERVRERLRALDAGIVTVRTRGGAVDPDVASRKLRGRGEVPIDLHVLRVGRRLEAFLVDKMPSEG